MSLNIIVDANVVVSAQLVQHPQAFPFRVWAAVFEPTVQNYASAEVLEECIDVLQRREVSRRHGLSRTDILQLISAFATASAEVMPPRSLAIAPDPGDQHLWDMLAADANLLLVTGDPKLLESDDFPGRVLSPRQFVEQFLDD